MNLEFSDHNSRFKNPTPRSIRRSNLTHYCKTAVIAESYEKNSEILLNDWKQAFVMTERGARNDNFLHSLRYTTRMRGISYPSVRYKRIEWTNLDHARKHDIDAIAQVFALNEQHAQSFCTRDHRSHVYEGNGYTPCVWCIQYSIKPPMIFRHAN